MQGDRDQGREGAPEARLAPAPDSALDLGDGLWLARSELRWRFSRASGPGGQNVNKTDARVELRFPLAATAVLPPQIGRAHV